jgi:hypothetical protein
MPQADVEEHLLANYTVTMRKWWFASLCLLALLLAAASTTPWLAYWIGLRKIEGRPLRSVRDITAEDVDRLCKHLRISQPLNIDALSPYSYFFQGNPPSDSVRIAWLIAKSYNVDHVDDRRYWHLAGAALTIWLTRNWTSSELVATAIEVDSRAADSNPRQVR